jgi:hypothetical protein
VAIDSNKLFVDVEAIRAANTAITAEGAHVEATARSRKVQRGPTARPEAEEQPTPPALKDMCSVFSQFE